MSFLGDSLTIAFKPFLPAALQAIQFFIDPTCTSTACPPSTQHASETPSAESTAVQAVAPWI